MINDTVESALTADASSAVELIPGLALTGFGIGFVLVPLSATVLADVPPASARAAAGCSRPGSRSAARSGSPS